VIGALKDRAAHGVYGYDIRPEAYYRAIIGWMRRRHGWDVERGWITYTPGVVPAVNYAIQAFCGHGDRVLLQSPVYYPFFSAIENNGCEVIDNTLVYENGVYTIDFNDFEKKVADPRAKLFLLCSPHNPASRVWTREELTRMGEICAANNVIVIADEIHHDIVLGDKKHVVFADISDTLRDNAVTLTAPSKTFNLAGLYASNAIIPSEALRRRFQDVQRKNAVEMTNTFSIEAMRAAYDSGEAWLEELLEYLRGNAALIESHLQSRMPRAKLVPVEATYLAWIDIGVYGIEEPESFFAEHAKVGVHNGETFGQAGRNFIRLNFACPRSVLRGALDRMAAALEKA